MRYLVPESPLPDVLIAAGPLFLLFFLLVIIWVFRRGSGRLYQQVGSLPCDEDSGQDSPTMKS